MKMVRNLVQISLCVCLTGCTTLPGVVSRQPTPQPASSESKRQVGPVDPPPAATARGQASDGGVVYLELFGGTLHERAGVAGPPSPDPVVVPVPPNPDRIPALRRELADRLTLEVEALRTKLQDLNARVAARPTTPPDTRVDPGKTTIGELKQGIARIDERLRILAVNRPPSASTPRQIEAQAVLPVPHTGPIIPGDAPDASQREINRLIAQCLSDLENEVRELGDRVRVMTPPGADREAPR